MLRLLSCIIYYLLIKQALMRAELFIVKQLVLLAFQETFIQRNNRRVLITFLDDRDIICIVDTRRSCVLRLVFLASAGFERR